MIRGIRIANAVFGLLVLLGGSMQLVQHLDDWARTLGGLFGIALWSAPFFLAWRGLGPHSTLHMVRTAQRVNVLFVGLIVLVVVVIGVALLNKDFRFDGFLSVTLVCLVFGIPFVLNLRALGTRRAELAPVKTAPRTIEGAPRVASAATVPISTGNISTPKSTPPLSANYFARHWRGDLSLGVSYWLNATLLGGVLPAFVIVFLSEAAQKAESLRLIALVWIISVSAALILWLWGVVGIWRSSDKHVARGGKSIWASLAKLAVVLGAIGMAGEVTTSYFPMIKDMMLIASGNDPIGSYKATVSSDGKSIHIRGILRTDSAKEIEKLLDSAPAVKTLVLSSNGGRLLEGQILATAVSNRGLDTYVEDICLSTCTIVFLSGRERAATPNAKIGFHTPSFAGNDPDSVQASTRFMMDLYRRAGLPEPFLQKVRNTPAASMWYPARDELIDAHVITRVSLGGETTTGFTRIASKKELLLGLRSHPLWRAIETRFPDVVRKAVDRGWQMKEQGGTDNQIAAAIRNVIGELAPVLLRESSATSIEIFVKVMVDQMKTARAVSYQACQRLMNATLDPHAVFPKELRDREERWMLDALSSQPSRNRQYSAQAAENALATALSRIRPAYVDAISNPGKYQQRPDLVCDSIIATYETVLSLPADQRGAALEGMFKGGA